MSTICWDKLSSGGKHSKFTGNLFDEWLKKLKLHKLICYDSSEKWCKTTWKGYAIYYATVYTTCYITFNKRQDFLRSCDVEFEYISQQSLLEGVCLAKQFLKLFLLVNSWLQCPMRDKQIWVVLNAQQAYKPTKRWS